MKKQLLLIFVWISCNLIHAQKTTTNYAQDSQPITTTGISLPQLITTNINRSNLQFGINLSNGLVHPNLSVSYEKFISDESKQIRITGGASLNHTFSFESNEISDFYTVNSSTINLGADLKFFNKQNYFIQFATQNTLGKIGGISDFENFSTSNSLTLGIGKGRINYVNDGTAAISITAKVSEYGLLNRELTENEYYLLVQKINDLKNRRKYVNRSYPLTETEEIQDLFMTLGLISEEDDIIAIIDDAYKYEPMVDRTTGSQFRIATTGSYHHSNIFDALNFKGLSGSISYMNHTPINAKWQYNKGAELYISATETNYSFPSISDNKLRKAGLGIINNLHNLIDNKMRLSFLTTTGYNFINKQNPFDPSFNDNGFYINTSTQLEHQISRTMSTTFGIDLNLSQKNTYTGLRLGLTF